MSRTPHSPRTRTAMRGRSTAARALQRATLPVRARSSVARVLRRARVAGTPAPTERQPAGSSGTPARTVLLR